MARTKRVQADIDGSSAPRASAMFTGKGIYDVDAFEAATGETFPETAS